jgi:hypothetical protein
VPAAWIKRWSSTTGFKPMASAKGIDLGERGLGIEALRPNNISN